MLTEAITTLLNMLDFVDYFYIDLNCRKVFDNVTKGGLVVEFKICTAIT